VRHLRAAGLAVRFVRNVTDVDDKIIRRALTEKRSAAEVARDYTEKMEADLEEPIHLLLTAASRVVLVPQPAAP